MRGTASFSIMACLSLGLILGLGFIGLVPAYKGKCGAGRDESILNPASGSEGKTEVTRYRISIEIFPDRHGLMCRSETTVKNQGQFICLNLNKNFKIDSVFLDGREVMFQFDREAYRESRRRFDDDNVSSDFRRSGRVKIDAGEPGEHTLMLEYEGSLFEEPTSSRFSREYVANQTSGIISEQGAFFSPDSFWYPRGDEGMSTYEVTTITPIGFETVTQGRRIRHEIQDKKLVVRWKSDHPSDSLYLQAGPYEVQESSIEGIKVYTYFFPGGSELASLYLKKSMQYITMYSELFGTYPYEKFAVVENFFETGYGMPSWTLLGRTVVRLPFIPDTSLPHEICHNWWGNGVFVDYSQGNWCEGLTVYCADHWLKKKAVPGGGVDYRLQINRDYASYVKKNNDFPLSEFRTRHDPVTRVVGYGKTMMVYHQLQRMVGEQKFFRSLRRLMKEHKFKKAAWKDVLGVFEEECSLDLEKFYHLWVEQSGAPVIRLGDVRVERDENGCRVSFGIIQEGDLYKLDVPVLIKTEKEAVLKNLKVEDHREEFSFRVSSRPMRIEVDPESHLFRRLYPEEIPPSIAKVFGAENQLIVLPSKVEPEMLKKYRTAAEMINRTKTGIIKEDNEVKLEDLQSNALILFGASMEDPLVSDFLAGVKRESPWDREEADQDDAGSVLVMNHPVHEEYAVMVIDIRSKGDILAVTRKLPHYGKYSYLLFHGAENARKGIWKVESSPLIHIFRYDS